VFVLKLNGLLIYACKQDEFEGCWSKCVIRTASEITAPFTAVTSPEKTAGLEMIHHDQLVYPFSVKVAWEEMKQQGLHADSQR
jgi:hypothetical protein